MDVTLFLTQAFGLYFLIGGLGLVLHQASLKAFVRHFSSDEETIMMGGYLSLLIGVPLVLIHSMWATPMESTISILVWLTLLKGASRVLMPGAVMQMSQSFLENTQLLKMLIWFMVALGACLTYVGFWY